MPRAGRGPQGTVRATPYAGPVPVTPPNAARRARVREETPVALTRRARRMYRSLHERYPYAHCELDFETPLQLLLGTILGEFPAAARVVNRQNALAARLERVTHLRDQLVVHQPQRVTRVEAAQLGARDARRPG